MTTFTFDASNSTDSNTPTDQLEVRWMIGNATNWNPWTTDKTITYKFWETGVHYIGLEVRNAQRFVGAKDSSINIDPFPYSTGEFIVENLGVTFAPLAKVTNLAGDFLFSEDKKKIFWEFGAHVRDYNQNIKELPHFSYTLKKDAFIVAIAEGEVTSITDQGGIGDFEFSIQSMNDPSYIVNYDHVIDVRVALGEYIQAGDTVAAAIPTWDDRFSFIEIQKPGVLNFNK